MDPPEIVAIVAALVGTSLGVLNFVQARRAERTRLQIHIHKEQDRTVRVSISNIGRRGQLVVECGLIAGERDLPTSLVDEAALPRRLRSSDFHSVTVRLTDSKRGAPSIGQVTGAWVRNGEGKRFESRPAHERRAAISGGITLPPRTRARLNTAIFAVAIYALLWALTPRPPCVEILIASSNEKESLLQYVAREFNSRPTAASFGLARCEVVRVSRHESGVAASALFRGWDLTDRLPDVWAPAGQAWARVVSHDLRAGQRPDVIPRDPPTIAQSPLVVAMLRTKAERLGWLDQVRDKTWTQIFDLAKDPRVWRDYEPRWGPFRVTRTRPTVSTSGLHTFIAQYAVATGGWAPSCEGVASVLADVQEVERSVFARGGDSVRSTFDDLYAADSRGGALTFLSAIPVEESQLWQYNRGNPQFRWTGPLDPAPRDPPTEKLVALYPATGTLLADHPYLVLNWPGVPPEEDRAKRAVAERFLNYLLAPQQQAFFREAGFRDRQGQLGEGKGAGDGLDRGGPRSVAAAPAGDSIRCILDSWLRMPSASTWPPIWAS